MAILAASPRRSSTNLMDFDVLQLIDSAFPIGSFAHSGGLEAFCVLTDTGFGGARDRAIRGTESFEKFQELVVCVLENSGSLQVPYVRDAVKADAVIAVIASLDRSLHLLLSNHVAKRASLQQGKSLAAAVRSTFSKHAKAETFSLLCDAIDNGHLSGHFAIVFGYVCSVFELDTATAAGIYLFGLLRTVMGSAVRMGLFGPLKAQELQNQLQTWLPELVEKSLAVTEPHICHPILEIAQNAHDKMFAKLFYS